MLAWELKLLNWTVSVIMYKIKGFLGKIVCVIHCSFHISHFQVCWSVLLVDVFSQLYYLTYAKKQQRQTDVKNRYNHESW